MTSDGWRSRIDHLRGGARAPHRNRSVDSDEPLFVSAPQSTVGHRVYERAGFTGETRLVNPGNPAAEAW